MNLITNKCCLAGDPVEIGMEIAIASFDSISEVNMVSYVVRSDSASCNKHSNVVYYDDNYNYIPFTARCIMHIGLIQSYGNVVCSFACVVCLPET